MRPLVVALLVATVVGCASPAAPAPAATAARSAAPSVAIATGASAASRTSAPGDPAMTIALSDIRTGEQFTLGGFAGKTVIVEGMAVW